MGDAQTMSPAQRLELVRRRRGSVEVLHTGTAIGTIVGGWRIVTAWYRGAVSKIVLGICAGETLLKHTVVVAYDRR